MKQGLHAIYCFAACLISSIIFNTRGAAQALPRPDHIVVIIEENQPNFFVIGNTTAAPYINELASDTAMGATFTQMFALEHPSEPNYFDLFAGSNQGVLNDDPPANYPFTTPNMARELIDKGFSFITYSQNLPEMGSDVVSHNGYVRKHNPVVNWQGTGTNQVPITCNQGLENFPTDFSQLPTVSYVIPVEDSDMHNGFGNPTIAAGDYWLKEHLKSYIDWAKTHNSLFIYTFDEDDGLQGNNIPTVFYGPMVKGGSYTQTYNLYNILRTIEDMYGTSYAGEAEFSIPILPCWRAGYNTGVNDVNKSVDVKVYPNPAADILKFETAQLPVEEALLTFTDITGRVVFTRHIKPHQTIDMNTQPYAPGVYFYTIAGNSMVLQTGKVLVAR